MRIAIDFDDTIVKGNFTAQRDYFDVTTPLEFLPNAKEVLYQLKEMGHQLILYSARACRTIRFDWNLDPLPKPKDSPVFTSYLTNELRYLQMINFAATELPGLFAYIDDGSQGKIGFDIVIDDRNYPLKKIDWLEVLEYFKNLKEYVDPYNIPVVKT